MRLAEKLERAMFSFIFGLLFGSLVGACVVAYIDRGLLRECAKMLGP